MGKRGGKCVLGSYSTESGGTHRWKSTRNAPSRFANEMHPETWPSRATPFALCPPTSLSNHAFVHTNETLDGTFTGTSALMSRNQRQK